MPMGDMMGWAGLAGPAVFAGLAEGRTLVKMPDPCDVRRHVPTEFSTIQTFSTETQRQEEWIGFLASREFVLVRDPNPLVFDQDLANRSAQTVAGS